MTDQEWGGWLSHHAALFQLHGDADAIMFAAWRPLLDHYFQCELVEASNWLVLQKPNSKTQTSYYRTEHLRLLTRRISNLRAEAVARVEADRNAGPPSCYDCRGIGVVAVPHPQCVQDSHWISPWYTAAVTCRCPRGQDLHRQRLAFAEERQRRDLRPMSLEHFEVICPTWRQELKRREQIRAQEMEANRLAAAADRAAKNQPMAVARDVKAVLLKFTGKN